MTSENSQDTIPILTITLPKDTQWNGQRATQFMDQMLLGFNALIFRMVATHDAIQWQVVDMARTDAAPALESAIRASYPDASINITEFDGEFCNVYPTYRYVVKYQQPAETFLAPLRYASDITNPDPLSHVMEFMGNLLPDERVIYNVFVHGVVPESVYKEGERQLTRRLRDGTVWGMMNPIVVDRYTPDLMRVCTIKRRARLYHASVFIQMESPNRQRVSTLLAIDNQMTNFARPQFGMLSYINDKVQIIEVSEDNDIKTSAIGQLIDIFYPPQKSRGPLTKLKAKATLVLEPEELAALWHLPHRDCITSTIQWAFGAARIPSVLRGNREGACFGVNDFAGRQELVYVPDRSGHVAIVGQSGVGKSNLMHHLIHQDIMAGHGVALIDPHGGIVQDVLRYSIPPQREKDVIVLDIADEEYPVPFNLLAVPKGIDRGNAANRLIGVLDRLYDLGSTPTVADALAASLITLAHDEQATIRDMGRLFNNDDYRQQLVAKLTNVAAIEFWERFEETKKGRDAIIRPVLWRLRSLYTNTVLYPMVCHPDTLDISRIVAHNKILLVSLKANEARIPMREQHLLGLILLTQLQQAAMLRPPSSPVFYLYVDEVQHFVTTTFETLLSEARKNQVVLTTANQYLRQLTGDMLDSIMGNVGTMLVFQTGLADARLLEPYVAPHFDAQHLMHLNKYEAAMITRYRSQSLEAFSLKTFIPLSNGVHPEQAVAREQYLRQLSRQHYIPKHRSVVEEWLASRYAAGISAQEDLALVEYE